MTPTLSLIPALEDNYIYLIHWDDKAIAIDPAEAKPVIQFCEKNDLSLIQILNTHHHWDHTAGNETLKEKYGCPIVGPEDPRIPGLSETTCEGETVTIGPLSFQVLFVPGHTTSHIAFYEKKQHWLFCGDALFTGGCGKLFEGTPQEMFDSLQKLTALPEETKVYCGHEYTLKNMEFAHSLEPQTKAITARLEHTRKARKDNQPTVGSTLQEEKRTNPFLRFRESSLRQTLQLEKASDVDVFTKTRELRNSF